MSNLDRLRDALALDGPGAFVVSDPVNVGWLTGFTGSFGFVLVATDAAHFVSDSRYTLQAAEEVQGFTLHTLPRGVEAPAYLAGLARDASLSEVGFESASVTYRTYEKWAEAFADIALVSMPDLLDELRKVKTPAEIAAIREACGLADACFAHVQRMIQEGVSEYDVALDIEFFMRRNGAEIAFPVIAVSGERSARPHGKPSERRLTRGDFVTLDFGAKLNGYHSDITRTVVVGHASDRHREVYEAVLRAQLAALDAMRPGVSAAEVDGISRKVLGEVGLAEAFGHGLGHGLGRLVHDPGRLSGTSTDVLKVGQVWTVEPGVYLEGFGGVRIEDDVVVTETGIDILTTSSKDLLVL